MTGVSDPTAQHAHAALEARLDAATLRRAPASLAAVFRDGQIIAVRAHGEPRRDGAATTPETVFRIASMSKSFLAATALSLRDEGLLDLHAPAVRYVPELATAHFDGVAVGETLTLDALLSNRGGLSEDNAWGDEHLGEPRSDMARIVADGLTLSTRPGTEYQYSNLGISIIGRAIEAVTGREVEDVIRERLLEPLGLAQTRASAELYPVGTDLAAGFRTFDDGESFASEPYVGTGALGCIGSLFSTVADIAVWAHFLGSAFGAEPAHDDVLSAASRRQMQVARTLIPASGDFFGGRKLDGAGYGYGLVVEHDARFGRVVQHAGGLPGFSSHMRWHAATGLGVVVFGNSDAYGAGRIAGDVLSDLLARTDAPAAVVRPWPATLDAAHRIDDALRAGRGLDSIAGLFARNVLRDVPQPVRERRLRTALDEIGEPVRHPDPFSSRVVSAADESSLRWTIPCASGALVCDVHLVGLREPLVQSLDVQVAGDDGRKPREESARVTDHHRVEFD